MIGRESYLGTAKQLSLGDSCYIPHDGCTDKSKMWVYHSDNGYGAYCNKCGDKGFTGKGIRKLSEVVATHSDEEYIFSKEVSLPDDYSTDIDDFSLDARLWLYKSDIRNDDIATYNIGYSKSLRRVIIPLYAGGELVMWQGRGLTSKQTKYLNVAGFKKNDVLYVSDPDGFNLKAPEDRSKIVVVEDALSVIRVGEYCFSAAALGTSISDRQYNYLSSFKKVIFWYDDDLGGWNGSKKAVRRLAMVTDCYRVRTEEDPKSLSRDQILDVLGDALND